MTRKWDMALIYGMLLCLEMQSVSKHLPDALYAGDEGIDILAGIVEGEAGAAGSLNTHAAHQGFSTMMARADSDAETVEQSAHIKVVDRPPSPL